MTRARALALGLASLAFHAALLAGAGAALPGPVRVALAFGVLVLVPGWAFVALGARPPGGSWLAAGWALGFGVAWASALALLAHTLVPSFLPLTLWMLPANAALWGVVVWRGRVPWPDGAPTLPRWAVLAVLLAAGVAAWTAGSIGPPTGYGTDTPDHVGTLRRMLLTGQAFPTDAFFRDAGRMGADPRKGVWHVVIALITRLAAVDPLESWRWLGSFIVPFFVLTVAGLGYLCRGPIGAGLAAWALLLTFGGGLWSEELRQMAFASHFGDQLALAAVVAVLADLRMRARGTRVSAAILGFAAVATHVFAAVHFAVVFSALALGLLLRDRRVGPDLRRLVPTVLLMAAACLPYVVMRAGQAYAPTNIIHTEPQGLLTLVGTLRVVTIGALWTHMGEAWVLVPLAWPWLWARGRHNPAVLYLLTSSLAVGLIMYDPPVVALLQPRLGYLLMRLIWLVPLAGILGWLLPELAARVAATGPWARRAAAGVVLALAVVLLAAPARDAATVLLAPEPLQQARREYDPRRWGDVFAWMNAHLPPDDVVLSDLATSYMVPMMTGRYVVAIVDQHSSPNDSLALRRILDTRDALDPYEPWARMRDVIGRYGVSVIVLDGRLGDAAPLLYWTPTRSWYAAERARLDSAPGAFERLADLRGVVVYRVRPRGLDRLASPPAPRPFVRPVTAGDALAPESRSAALPAIVGFALRPERARPGDTLRCAVDWRAPGPMPPGSYTVAVRFDRPLPAGWSPPAFLGKPWRKLLERRLHERLRFRDDHLPVGGIYGVDLWRPDQVVRDEFSVAVPRDVAPGEYVVRVRMIRSPVFANFRLSDYFFDQDYFAGRAVGSLRLLAPRGSVAAAEAARVRD